MTRSQGSPRQPLMIAVGGGKGGVGKSMVCSNFAVQYAQAGLQVIAIDLDVGAANLHTIFGLRQPPKGLADYLTHSNRSLTDYLVQTSLPNLKLITGSGFVPELANLSHEHKLRLITEAKRLPADLVLLDLGAGSALNTIDFFSMTHAGIVVTTPEPTSIVNAYEFLKNVIYRILFRIFRTEQRLLKIVQSSAQPSQDPSHASVDTLIQTIDSISPAAARTVSEICQSLHLHLIFNQARRPQDVMMADKLYTIARRFLGLKLHFGGMIFHQEEVSASVFKMAPISCLNPDSLTAKTLARLSTTFFYQVTQSLINKEEPRTFEQELAEASKYAQEDYKQALLAKKRMLRAEEFAHGSLDIS